MHEHLELYHTGAHKPEQIIERIAQPNCEAVCEHDVRDASFLPGDVHGEVECEFILGGVVEDSNEVVAEGLDIFVVILTGDSKSFDA